MTNKQTRGTIRQRGFSLLELLIVVAIIVAVSAFAIPKFQDALADIRLRANANSLSSLLQQARMQAVKTNTACTARSNGSIVSVFNAAGAAVGGPAVAITSETSFSDGTGGPAALPSLFPAATTPTKGSTVNLTFNDRGLPCDPTVANCPPGTYFAYYLQQTRNSGTAWAMVAISPAGRIKTYRWLGPIATGSWQ